jgi:hypothetical protein
MSLQPVPPSPTAAVEAVPAASPYEMTVDLNVLDHLGINLYSNIAAVLTEAVANAWDADAEKVEIRVDSDSQWIEIEDDGIGMTVADMNEKYLRVGYRRRERGGQHGRVTAKKRPVMGRKGLGKLSLFSIAGTIEVQSAKDGTSHGLHMTAAGIQQSVASQEQSYHPEVLAPEKVKKTKGTLIRLEDIKRQRLSGGVAAMKKRLARRFSILGQAHGFEISIDGHLITSAERGDLPVAQFIWYFGEPEPDLKAAKDLLEKESLPDRLEHWDQNWRIKGWVGTARLPKQLDSEDAGNLNSIVVFARGRLFHENILDRLNDGRLYTKYLTGQIEADFLDDDDKPDIATSDRQRVQEDDDRYRALVVFLRERMTQLEKRWLEWRKKHEVDKAKELHPALAEWLDTLPVGFKQSAETMVAKISALPIDKEDDRKVMYRHSILAFERMKLSGSEAELIDGIDDPQKLLSLFADRDSLEASLYRDIVKGRLDVIRAFQKLTDADSKEKVLQEYLFDHLWLLDPAWERATGSEIMETRMAEEGVSVTDFTEKEKLGRVDIKYRTNAGKHIIVELKKAGRKMKLIDLQEQGSTYVDKVKKILVAQGVKNPDIEVVFVLGQPLDEESVNPDRLKKSMEAVSQGSRVVYYDSLIRSAQDSYSEFITKSKKLDRLEGIVNRL